MVDPFALASDIVTDSVSLVLPAAIWALFFLLAFEHPSFAESVGLGRRAFWLLFLGSLLATFAILPFGTVSYDIVAVSFGGAIFPLLIGALAVLRMTGGSYRLLTEYLAFLAVGSVAMLLLVLPLAAPVVSSLASGAALGTNGSEVLLLFVVAVVLVLAAAVVPNPAGGSPGRTDSGEGTSRPLVFLVGLSMGTLLATFAGSSAIPGVGIVEQFPYYLLPPIVAGGAAVLLAPWFVPRREGFALPLVFFATTFGTLLGADLLRQPPLYGTGPAGIYTIGGAGVLDLVYLSGLLALGTAFLVHYALGRPFLALGPAESAGAPAPVGRLARAFRAGVDGALSESLAESARAGHEAAEQARALLGLPAAPAGRPWDGLPVPGWVVSDQTNLDAIARSGSKDGREGFRAWLTARWLVTLGRDLGQRRFGSLGARTVGFLCDLLIVTIPAVGVWTAIVLATPGNLYAALSSLPFNAAIYAYVSLAFLYFAVFETVTGSSPGKRLVRLAVRDKSLRPIGFVPALVRNSTVLPTLTVVGVAAALGVAFLFKTGPLASVTVGGIPIPGGVLVLAGVIAVLAAAVGLLGAFGVLVISLNSERQRLGDLLAGTWVVRDLIPAFGAAPSAVASPQPPPVPPPSA